MSSPQYIVSYVFPSHGIIHEAFARSLLGLGIQLPPAQVIVRPSARPYAARNNIIADWLDNEAFADIDWLFFVDTDEQFSAAAVAQLLKDAVSLLKEGEPVGVVGGLVFRWNEVEGRPEPTMYFWNPDRGDWSMSVLYPEKSLARVDATGAGNIFIHRAAAEAVREKFGDYWFEDVKKVNAAGEVYTQGNDLTFCERVGEVGFQVWVDTSAEFGHGKQFWLGEKEAALWREQNLDLS